MKYKIMSNWFTGYVPTRTTQSALCELDPTLLGCEFKIAQQTTPNLRNTVRSYTGGEGSVLMVSQGEMGYDSSIDDWWTDLSVPALVKQLNSELQNLLNHEDYGSIGQYAPYFDINPETFELRMNVTKNAPSNLSAKRIRIEANPNLLLLTKGLGCDFKAPNMWWTYAEIIFSKKDNQYFYGTYSWKEILDASPQATTKPEHGILCKLIFYFVEKSKVTEMDINTIDHQLTWAEQLTQLFQTILLKGALKEKWISKIEITKRDNDGKLQLKLTPKPGWNHVELRLTKGLLSLLGFDVDMGSSDFVNFVLSNENGFTLISPTQAPTKEELFLYHHAPAYSLAIHSNMRDIALHLDTLDLNGAEREIDLEFSFYGAPVRHKAVNESDFCGTLLYCDTITANFELPSMGEDNTSFMYNLSSAILHFRGRLVNENGLSMKSNEAYELVEGAQHLLIEDVSIWIGETQIYQEHKIRPIIQRVHELLQIPAARQLQALQSDVFQSSKESNFNMPLFGNNVGAVNKLFRSGMPIKITVTFARPNSFLQTDIKRYWNIKECALSVMTAKLPGGAMLAMRPAFLRYTPTYSYNRYAAIERIIPRGTNQYKGRIADGTENVAYFLVIFPSEANKSLAFQRGGVRYVALKQGERHIDKALYASNQNNKEALDRINACRQSAKLWPWKTLSTESRFMFVFKNKMGDVKGDVHIDVLFENATSSAVRVIVLALRRDTISMGIDGRLRRCTAVEAPRNMRLIPIGRVRTGELVAGGMSDAPKSPTTSGRIISDFKTANESPGGKTAEIPAQKPKLKEKVRVEERQSY